MNITARERASALTGISGMGNPTAVLALVAVAQFMVILDASVVNVAIPTIKRDLGFSERNLSWILNAYTLMFGGSCQVVFGPLKNLMQLCARTCRAKPVTVSVCRSWG